MDLAHPGFEDIDIDLDFAQADEDMELADFETLNSDGRDELMGDGDDESYMIDADNMAHNAAAAAANDIEIDIGGSDEQLLPGPTAFNAPHQVDEIDYAPNLDIGEQNVQSGDWFQPTIEQVPASVDTAQVESAVDTNTAVAVDATPAQETMALSMETAALPVEVTNVPATADKAEGIDGFGLDESYAQVPQTEDDVDITEQENALPSNLVDESAVPTETGEDVSGVQHDEEHNISSTDRQPAEEVDETKPVEHIQLNNEPDDNDPLVDNDLEAPQVAQDSESTADPAVEANGAGDYLYDEHADEDAYAKEGDDETKASPKELDLQNEDRGEDEDEGENEGEGEDKEENEDGAEAPDHHPDGPHDSSAHELAEEDRVRDVITEDAASIAARHEMYISYGQTDYRLFAKGEDDDPNQYFLKDTTALELSLSGFLTSLREVISEEVSPLDELALHVDGLGLEFAEVRLPPFSPVYNHG